MTEPITKSYEIMNILETSWMFVNFRNFHIKQESLVEFMTDFVFDFMQPGEEDSAPVPVCWLTPLAERLMSCESGSVAHEVRNRGSRGPVQCFFLRF